MKRNLLYIIASASIAITGCAPAPETDKPVHVEMPSFEAGVLEDKIAGKEEARYEILRTEPLLMSFDGGYEGYCFEFYRVIAYNIDDPNEKKLEVLVLPSNLLLPDRKFMPEKRYVNMRILRLKPGSYITHNELVSSYVGESEWMDEIDPKIEGFADVPVSGIIDYCGEEPCIEFIEP